MNSLKYLLLQAIILFILGAEFVKAKTNEACIQGAKCFTQTQMNCFFYGLIPLILIVSLLIFLMYFKFKKQFIKLHNLDKTLYILVGILLFYFICLIIVKYALSGSCVG